ncbi:MAG TPA: hypothetical protein PLP89_01585 [Synergistales bacterium]|nr:hypothetical protein [Synergistales bacterium]
MKKRVSVIFATLLVALFVILSGEASAEDGLWVFTSDTATGAASVFDISDISPQIGAIRYGGKAGQVLTKTNDEDFWTDWMDVYDWSPRVGALESAVAGHDRRISDLEETQYVFGLNMRVFDSRKMSWNVFANYSANRSKLDRVGVELTLKFGKSYEEKQIEDLRAEIAELKALLQN